MQTETRIRYDYITIRMAKIKNTANTKWWQRCTSFGACHVLLVGMQNGTYRHTGKQFVSCLLSRLLAYDSVIPLLYIYPREKNLDTDIYRSSIHNIAQTGSTPKSFNR